MVLLSSPSMQPSGHPVYARSGWKIPTEKPNMLDSWHIRNKTQELLRRYPNSIIRSVSDYSYNCVGMIFASRRAFIEVDHIYRIFREDGYHQVARMEVMVGDVVLYRDIKNEPSHVALIVNAVKYDKTIDIKVLSKWGWLAEVEHFIDDVPNEIVGKPAEFWTERQI